MTQWSPQQDAALKAVSDWYKNRRQSQQVFRLFGHAGTGKTTLAKHFAQDIEGTVKFATFTGKAAHVMASKGCIGASTIHRLIYQPKVSSKTRLKDLEKELEHHERNPEPNFEAISRIREEIVKERENAGRMSFSLNLGSDLRFAKLLILDECSMISTDVGKDLESFGVPILVLGDPEQLPPIYGQGYFTEKEPDILLTEIHRQALDNPIVKMAEMIRLGRSIPIGEYGSSRVINEPLDAAEILGFDTILTGLRRTKKACDDKCRSVLGRTSPLPMAGDKVMCVKNNHDLGLLNGQVWEVVSDAVPMGGGMLSLYLQEPDSEVEIAVCASEKLFLGQQLQRWEHEDDVQEFEYAYAITVHKAQGSQWGKVLVFDEKHRFPNLSQRDQQRWLYTAITRAAESVTVMRL